MEDEVVKQWIKNESTYFTRIEEHFQRRRGFLLLLPARDWNLIAAWKKARIPVEIVLRGIDATFDKHIASGEQRPINGLRWCAKAVSEEFKKYAAENPTNLPV